MENHRDPVLSVGVGEMGYLLWNDCATDSYRKKQSSAVNPTRSLRPDARIQMPIWPTWREALAKSPEITQTEIIFLLWEKKKGVGGGITSFILVLS